MMGNLVGERSLCGFIQSCIKRSESNQSRDFCLFSNLSKKRVDLFVFAYLSIPFFPSFENKVFLYDLFLFPCFEISITIRNFSNDNSSNIHSIKFEISIILHCRHFSRVDIFLVDKSDCFQIFTKFSINLYLKT